MRHKGLIAAVVIAGLYSAGLCAQETRDARERAKDAAGEIIGMRSSLAKAFIEPDAPVTIETFKKVCGAVGKRVKELTGEGLEIRHAAVKFRNPGNAATPAETELIKRFEREDGLESVEGEFEREDGPRYSVTRPIYVEKACLSCHGEKDRRPEFIVEKYPQDSAYGFKEGDLRGIITVTAPLD